MNQHPDHRPERSNVSLRSVTQCVPELRSTHRDAMYSVSLTRIALNILDERVREDGTPDPNTTYKKIPFWTTSGTVNGVRGHSQKTSYSRTRPYQGKPTQRGRQWSLICYMSVQWRHRKIRSNWSRLFRGWMSRPQRAESAKTGPGDNKSRPLQSRRKYAVTMRKCATSPVGAS